MDYLPHDQELKDGISLVLNQDGGLINLGGIFGGGFILRKTPIEFQFVPKILSDSRKGSWDENEVLAREPVSNVATVGPRIMSMQWTYIVEEIGNVPDGSNFNPQLGHRGRWSIARIKRNINILRGYFLTARSRDEVGSHKGLVCFLTWPLVGGLGTWTCRITSVDIKHSDNMVGNRNIMFPVKSDVTIDIRLWTKGNVDLNDESETTQNIRDQKRMPSIGDLWY